jgi:transcriptional regulator with XRE-family HTH domain
VPRPKYDLPQFGPNLRRIREAKGLSQAALAEAVGLRQNHISDLEAGKSQPYLSLAVRLAEALKIEVKKFLEKIPNSD